MRRISSKLIFLPVFNLMLASGLLAAPPQKAALHLQLKKSMYRTALNPHAEILEDKTGRLQFRDVRDQTRAKSFEIKKTNSFGFTKSTFWVRLTVQNPTAEALKWYLEFDYCVFDKIELYLEQAGERPVMHGGDMMPFHERIIDYRNVVFPLIEPAGEARTYYLKLQSTSSMTIPLFAYTEYEFFRKATKEQIILGFYYGTMLVMFVYNFFLFISTRDASYLFYIFHILIYNTFQATLNGLTFQYLWPDNFQWGNRSLPFLILAGQISPLLFARSFLNSKKNTPRTEKLYWPLIALSGAGCVAALFWDYFWSIYLAIILIFPLVALIFVNGFQCLFLGQRSARFFLIAWTAFLAGVVLYASKAFGLVPDNFFTVWAIQIGSVSEVVLLSLGLADRINELSRNLQLRVQEVNAARIIIEDSEKKYRNLFENDDDFIFTLDENWRFQSANKALYTMLGFQPEEVVGKNFLELIQKSEDNVENFSRLFVMQKLEELCRNRKSVRIQAEFCQKHVPEPKELLVSLQFMEYDKHREILGKASDLFEEVPYRFLTSERISFSTNNYLQNVEPLSRRLTKNLLRYTDANTAQGIKYALREIIINAIEHGNLNISFDEKTRAMETEDYFQFIKRRQKDPRFSDKKITIEYVLKKDKVGFRITDEGEGFDHKKRMKTDIHELAEQRVTHGRGIFMTLNIFDVVKYNEKGNQVALIKHLHGNDDMKASVTDSDTSESWNKSAFEIAPMEND